MKIIYTGVQYSFYKKEYGLSFEHNNFYLSLKNLPGVEVIYFPFDRILEVGKKKFNQELREAIEKEEPELLFVFMLSDEVSPELLDEVKKKGKTKTLAWFADDHWRFFNYSRYWAPHFDWAVTTAYPKAAGWYRRIGYRNVIYSQWAANAALYKPSVIDSHQSSVISYQSDVSLVGSWNQSRDKIIKALQRAGIPVAVYGAGWKTGRLSEGEMIRLFSESKVNLGINAPSVDYSLKSLGKIFFRRSVNRIVQDFSHFPQNLHSWLSGKKTSQIKARIFEIPACGGFLMTGYADDLEKYYALGKEIIVYENIPDLVEKVRYYLGHDEERERIARAGYERTIREHTYEKRFREIFKTIGLHYAP